MEAKKLFDRLSNLILIILSINLAITNAVSSLVFFFFFFLFDLLSQLVIVYFVYYVTLQLFKIFSLFIHSPTLPHSHHHTKLLLYDCFKHKFSLKNKSKKKKKKSRFFNTTYNKNNSIQSCLKQHKRKSRNSIYVICILIIQ